MTKGWTPKQQRFIDEYLIDLNATQAAIRAGYSAKTANEQGAQLLAKLSTPIQAAMDKRSQELQIDANYVLSTIVDTIERCKQARPVLGRDGKAVYVDTPDGDLVPAYTFEANAVLKGAELLGKHLKLFTDKTELTGKDGAPLFKAIERVIIDPK